MHCPCMQMGLPEGQRFPGVVEAQGQSLAGFEHALEQMPRSV